MPWSDNYNGAYLAYKGEDTRFGKDDQRVVVSVHQNKVHTHVVGFEEVDGCEGYRTGKWTAVCELGWPIPDADVTYDPNTCIVSGEIGDVLTMYMIKEECYYNLVCCRSNDEEKC